MLTASPGCERRAHACSRPHLTRPGRTRGGHARVRRGGDGPVPCARYVCDGTSRRAATISQWFRGSWDRRAPVTLRAGGRTLRLRPPGPDGRISGRLIQDGTSNTFTVTPATGPAGLYDIRRGSLRATWVMLPDRRVRGVMIDPRPRKCRPVQVTLADGTTQIVTVCKTG